MNANQERQKLMYEGKVYEEQTRMISREMEKVTLTMLDLSNAFKTIENMGDTNTLVPIGGNTFLEAKMQSDKVLVPVGGGYMIKMEKKKAQKEVERRVESTKKVMEKLNKEHENLVKKMIEIDKKLMSLSKSS